jgi:hypothetical protein
MDLTIPADLRELKSGLNPGAQIGNTHASRFPMTYGT